MSRSRFDFHPTYSTSSSSFHPSPSIPLRFNEPSRHLVTSIIDSSLYLQLEVASPLCILNRDDILTGKTNESFPYCPTSYR